MRTPVLSIITVCFHAKEALTKTLDNVLNQTWKDFEYVVIDGASNDGTLELLEKYAEIFKKKNITFRYISEPDRGIYDAMNKGIQLACGNWLLFLNAGDTFANNNVLHTIFKLSSDADIIYGDALCTYQGQTKLYPALPLENLRYEMAFCHQSVFIRRNEMIKHPYDITYRVCADHRLFLMLYLEKKKFDYRNIPISVYEIAGYSDQNIMRAHKEQQRMQKELGIFQISLFWLKRECVFYIKQGLKLVFGQRLIDIIRKNRLR